MRSTRSTNIATSCLRMRDRPRLAIAVADAGSARAIVPVARLLLARGAAVSIAADGPAAQSVDADLPGADRLAATDDSTEADLAAAFAAAGVQGVLTGAGSYNQIEHRARLAARALSIPAIAVLDYWYEYESRFHRPDGAAQAESWPDLVCAPDEHARQGLIRAGCGEARISVTGPPNLEEAVHWFRTEAAAGAALGGRLGISPDRPVVAFFSEPHRRKPDGRLFDGPGGLYRVDGRPVFGYTALEILRHIIDAFGRLPREVRPQLLIKPHVLEWAEPLHDLAASLGPGGPVVIGDEVNPRALVALADAVMAMSSVTLIEAALAGTPAISVQIGLAADAPFDPCVGNLLSVTTPVFDTATLERVAGDIAAGRIFRKAAVPPSSLPVEGAAARVADAVLTRLKVAASQ